jgi:DNA-binding MarR family transcriptional regulator
MDDLPPKRSHGFATRRAHRAFDRLLNGLLSRHGLKSGYWYYLRALWIEDGQSQRRLSEATNTTENTTAITIGAMARAGLVRRIRAEGDRRSWVVLLTDRGEALRRELMPYAHQVNETATRGIPADELDICLDVLGRLASNLEAAWKSDDFLDRDRR